MTCAHCKASIEAVLVPLVDAKDVTVDLSGRTVSVDTEIDPQILVGLLAKIGFPATVAAG
jgi:copper chaperone CopZ